MEDVQGQRREGSRAGQDAHTPSGCGRPANMSLTYQTDEHLDGSPKNCCVYWFWRTAPESLEAFPGASIGSDSERGSFGRN